MSEVVPTDEEVVHAARTRIENSESMPGISKLLIALREEHHWRLSEKRLKNLLTSAGLRKHTSQVKPWIPVSSVDEDVPLPDGVKAVYFDSIKGRGLVATKPFAQGQSVFVEDAFLAAPPPSQLPKLLSGELCAHCFLPTSGSSIALNCSAGGGCQARFCNRICHARAQSTHHPLLCPGTNPSCKSFLQHLEQYQWHSLHSVSRAIARLLLTASAHPPPSISVKTGATVHGVPTKEAPASFQETLHHLDAFATVSELERRARNPGWDIESKMFVPALKTAHELLVKALDPREKSRSRNFPIKAEKLPAADLDRIFAYDTFLSRSGVRMATRISAQALRSINPGEELMISYVDPKLPTDRRRLLLWRDYCFGPCACQRCTKEQPNFDSANFDASAASLLAANTQNIAPSEAQQESASLEHELRSSLGF
ncbi:hypothetical protein MPSI1_002321 [Malassezia psittaci]|uniref:SET domain-containing protein n=1 Tax=Malassezia psittaci TaxID=1821823 RepID=A0AAF0FFH6_9BASI|nr:hypothetical protein MPSI1_002321 [Malassezia psittaci]